MKVTTTNTGRIFSDRENRLEWLSVGDYGKENNIHANFLGYYKKIESVKHSIVDLSEKWVCTISTQKGCSCNCRFCDVPKLKFKGNASMQDLTNQIVSAITYEDVGETKRFNVHYARMGEPTFNRNVLEFTEEHLDKIVRQHLKADVIHPVVSTMLPRYNSLLIPFLLKWCEIKNNDRNGEAGLQFSIQSTSDIQRDYQMQGKSLSLYFISEISAILPKPIGRKYTLNFAVTKDTILEPAKLTNLFDKDKWIVKLTPVHVTKAAEDISMSSTGCDIYSQFAEPLEREGWETIVFIPSPEEDIDRITCGNALLSYLDGGVDGSRQG